MKEEQFLQGEQRKIRIPIAVKLALAITLLVVGGMSSLGFIILENQQTVLTRQINDMGSAIVRQLANSSAEMVLSDDTLGLKTLANNLVDRQQIMGVAILSDKGLMLVSNGMIPSKDMLQLHTSNTLVAGHFEFNAPLSNENHYLSFHHPITFNQLIAGHAYVSFSKAHMVESLKNAQFVILTFTVLMSLIAIFLAFVMSRHLSKPIYSLVDASKAIENGNYRYRLNERRNDEIGELALAFNQMAHGLLQKTQVEDAFSRYVSSNVAQQVLQNLDEVELGGKHVKASVLFADIVGFTGISEKMPPDEVANLLNEYFSYISHIAQLHNGHIDKFMGDCAMVVFGVPEATIDHSFNAVSCAIMIQQTVKKLNKLREQDNKLSIHFRIGVNTGIMVAGNLGSSDRMEYTVIGDPVNMASRLASAAEADQIIVLEEFYNQPSIQSRISAQEHKVIRVRGKEAPVSTWIINDINPEYQENMQREIDQIIKKVKTVI
jgi:adenylate cyclase